MSTSKGSKGSPGRDYRVGETNGNKKAPSKVHGGASTCTSKNTAGTRGPLFEGHISKPGMVVYQGGTSSGGEGEGTEANNCRIRHAWTSQYCERMRQQRRQRDGRERAWLARLILLAFSLATPSAGFVISEGLLTQCFGLERIPRTMSSCSLILHKGPAPTCDDDFTFFTHDGRRISLKADRPSNNALSHSAASTFYTHDGRTIVPAECPALQPSSNAHWREPGQQDASLRDDVAVAILRSRYPGSTHQYAKARVEARPFIRSRPGESKFYSAEWLIFAEGKAAGIGELVGQSDGALAFGEVQERHSSEHAV